jgi:hypothetical protein
MCDVGRSAAERGAAVCSLASGVVHWSLIINQGQGYNVSVVVVAKGTTSKPGGVHVLT